MISNLALETNFVEKRYEENSIFLKKKLKTSNNVWKKQSLKRQLDFKGIASIALKSKTLAEKVWPEKAKFKKTMPEKVVTVLLDAAQGSKE